MIYGDQVRTILLVENATSITFSQQFLGDKLLLVWAREVYNPAQTLSGPRARAEEVFCRGRVIDGRGVKGNG